MIPLALLNVMKAHFFTPGHYIRLVHSGNQYFESLFHLIDSALHTLHLQVYIFELDDTGTEVLNHLKAASARGVQVSVIVDGYGSAALPSDFGDTLKAHRINFRFFSPVHWFKTINMARRLHQKICVADAKSALVGGINIGNKYHGKANEKPWFDVALYIEGPLCGDLDKLCNDVWGKKYYRKELIKKNPLLRAGGMMARMLQNDWLRGKNEISASYQKKLKSTNDSITIIASYFLPSRRLLNILLRCAKNGKSISIILSKQSDVPFIKPAIAYLYNRFLKEGIRIYEYHASVLHAKAVVVDKKWVSIGSHNLNHLSEFISMEVNIEVLDKNFGEAFSNELDLLIKHQCDEITYDSFELTNSLLKKGNRWLSYKLVSMSERVMKFFTRRL